MNILRKDIKDENIYQSQSIHLGKLLSNKLTDTHRAKKINTTMHMKA